MFLFVSGVHACVRVWGGAHVHVYVMCLCVCMCVCTHVHVYVMCLCAVHVCVSMCVLTHEAEASCLLPSFSTFFLETGSPTEQDIQLGWMVRELP